MSEQVTCKCERWHLKSMDKGHAWWFSPQRDHFGNTFHCETCGDRLNADGTVTQMVSLADAGAGALALLSRLIDVSHEVAAEDIPYKVTSPVQAVLAGLRDGYAHGSNRALSVMQGTICGMMQALRDRYGIAETEADETNTGRM